MRKIVSTLIAAFIVINLNAQIFDYGVNAGINSATLKMAPTEIKSTADATVFLAEAADASFGFHFGGQARVKFLGLFVEPAVQFSTLNSNIKLTEKVTSATQIVKESYNRLDIPIMVGYKFSYFKAFAGPVGSVLLSSKSEVKDRTGFEQALKRASWGYQVGLGFQYNKLAIDIKREGPITALGDSQTVSGQTINFDSRPSKWILQVSYFLKTED
ncbi:MAG TPA: hypothetical protein DCQ31_02215 [Bacteroidales bacterium]|nr:hypothetical protein [Bacteroidales bacterium]